MTTNVINKGWFNPISLSVFLILVIVSAVLYVSQIVNITGIHPSAPSFRVGGFCNPYCRPVGTGGSLAYGEIQRLERPRPLYDYPGYRQCVDLYRPACTGKCVQGRTNSDQRYGSGKCGCSRILDRLGRGKSCIGSTGISKSDRTYHTDRFKRYHR